MIALVNYGSGNIQAIGNIYGRLHIPFKIASKPSDLDEAERIVLPGVGHFDQAMDALNHSGMRDALDAAVMVQKKPLIGICVGMQLLAKSSEEGVLPGLGWVDGVVKRFVPGDGPTPMRLPHMGWNDVRPVKESPLFRDVDLGNGYYFLHSFYFVCNRREDVLAETSYGADFSCAVSSGNVYGVQFHPEKSHSAGIQLLKNFAELT